MKTNTTEHMTTNNTTEEISAELSDRAAKVGFSVSDSRAWDGTYWIPSIGRWRSVAQITEEIRDREEHDRQN